MSEIGQTIINIVRQKAAAQPDFVYDYPSESSTCMYVHKGKPSCLIGQALWAAGLIDGELEGLSYNTEDSNAIIRGYLDLNLDTDELIWLRDVQFEQDEHRPWAAAVALADGRQSSPEEDVA